MDKHEQARLIVLDYAMDMLEPKRGMRKSVFENVSYAKWTIDEILIELKRKRYLSPQKVIKNFEIRMWKYSQKDSDSNNIFEVAYRIASELNEIIRSI